MRQELLDHANWPVQIDFNLTSDVFEASSFVVNIDRTHNASVVNQHVEVGKLFGDFFVKSGDRFRIGNVASKGVNFWKARSRTVHLSLIAAGDKNRVTKRRELFGEFVTDAAGTAGDQNRIAREFHSEIPPQIMGPSTKLLERRAPSSRDRDTRHDREDCPRPSRVTSRTSTPSVPHQRCRRRFDVGRDRWASLAHRAVRDNREMPPQPEESSQSASL